MGSRGSSSRVRWLFWAVLGLGVVSALVVLAVALWFRQRDWYRRRIVVPASLMIAVVGAYWTVERVIGWG